MKRILGIIIALAIVFPSFSGAASRVQYPLFKAFNSSGKLLSGGRIWTYDPGTTTPKATYTSADEAEALPNPICLDSLGEEDVFLSGPTKMVLEEATTVGCGDVNHGAVVWTKDNVLPTADQSVSTIADLRLRPGGYNGEIVHLVAHTSSGDGGGGVFTWDASNVDADNNGTIVKVTAVTTGRWLRQYDGGEVYLAWLGAVGDFNPATGVGTDDRQAIQDAINLIEAEGGKVLGSPGKHYYLGTGYEESNWQIQIGSSTVSDDANNVIFDGNGATFYQGATGKAFVIHNANGTVFRARVIGYTGGGLSSARENDALVVIGHNSENTVIEDSYLTNSLGDCIFNGGAVDVADGGLGYHTISTTIRNNVIKERYGNGVASFSGGTRSREAIASIDAVGLKIYGNTIYGSIDFEPNISDQHIVNHHVALNDFYDGHVTAQTVIGTDYWHDEPIGITGGSSLDGAVKLQGVAGAPIISNNTVEVNSFETGIIAQSRIYTFSSIIGNTFKNGLISSGYDNVIGYTTGSSIIGNIADDVYPGESGFIKIDGQVANNNISNNTLNGSGSVYCVFVGTPSIGPAYDGGNTFFNNRAPSGAKDTQGTLASTSMLLSTKNPWNTNANVLVTIPSFDGTAATLSWPDYYGNSWYVQNLTASTARSISDISGSWGDGQELTIMAEAAGGGSLTLIHSSGMLLKGAVDAVMTTTQSVTLLRNYGRWIEIGRNF